MIGWRWNVGDWVAAVIDWLQSAMGGLFDAISDWMFTLVFAIEDALNWVPPVVLVIALGLIGWRLKGWRLAALIVVALLVLDAIDLWSEGISTLALVLAAAFVALVIGIPLGIIAGRVDSLHRIIRPVLDFMQTMPAFVYLIPAITLFGLGAVPALVATVIFSMPPVVRLTDLGIRQVAKDVVEAAEAFGSTGWQTLKEVQLPLALPTIMAGVNQTIMLALSMVVIASMIGAGGLGDVVLRGITRLDVGLGFEGGLGVVVLAILLDRITEALGQRRKYPA